MQAYKERNRKPDSTIEIITSEERIKTLHISFEGKENIALGKSAAQSSTGTGDEGVATAGENICNCPLTCTPEILAGRNGMPYSCMKRIQWLKSQYNTKTLDACWTASATDPTACGDGIVC